MVVTPDDALLMVICCPVGPYYAQGFKPVSLYGTTEFIRAAPGGKWRWRSIRRRVQTTYYSGIGSFKLGANYQAGLRAQVTASQLGYDQNLWLHGPQHLVTEVS